MDILSTPGGRTRKAEGEVFPYNPDPRLSADLPAILIFLASMPYEIHWRIQTQIQNLDVRSTRGPLAILFFLLALYQVLVHNKYFGFIRKNSVLCTISNTIRSTLMQTNKQKLQKHQREKCTRVKQ